MPDCLPVGWGIIPEPSRIDTEIFEYALLGGGGGRVVVQYLEVRWYAYDCCANRQHLDAAHRVHSRGCENLASGGGELMVDSEGIRGHIHVDLERDTFECVGRHRIPGFTGFVAGDDPEPSCVLPVQVINAVGLDVAHCWRAWVAEFESIEGGRAACFVQDNKQRLLGVSGLDKDCNKVVVWRDCDVPRLASGSIRDLKLEHVDIFHVDSVI